MYFRKLLVVFHLLFFTLSTDNEPPKTSNCPMPIYQTTTESSVAVTWTPPTFTDNVKVTEVTSTKNPNDMFTAGSTNVHYTATDGQSNSETCSFTINIKSKYVYIVPLKLNALIVGSVNR